MGTKVQCESYFPVYYRMQELNMESGNSWSRYYEEKTLSEHLYNGFALRPVNEYPEYDKEMLKRTMLEHEATFRTQVYELHRLYRIQKDLMDEFQEKGLYSYSVPADTSKSKSFSSQMPPEDNKRIWKMPHQPLGSNSVSTTPLASTDDERTPLKFLGESSTLPIPFPIENCAPLADNDIQISVNRFSGTMFDLRLPVDAYIDSEDTNRNEKENVAKPSSRSTILFSKTYGGGPETDVKLTLGIGEFSGHQEDSWKLNSRKQNSSLSHNLSDLNETVGEIRRKVASSSTCTPFLGPITHCEEKQRHQFPIRPTTSFLGLQGSLIKDRHSDEGSSSNSLFADTEEIRQEWPFYTNGSGESRRCTSFFTSDLHAEKLSMSSLSRKLKPTITHQISFPNKADVRFGQNSTLGIEIQGRSQHLSSSNYSGPVAPQTPSSISPALNLDYTLVSSSSEPAKANSTIHTPIAIQGLPCFNISSGIQAQNKRVKTSIQDSSNACDKWQREYNLRPHPRFGGEASSYSNGFRCHFDLDSSSTPFSKPSLSSVGENSAFWNSEDRGPHKCLKGLQCTGVSLDQAPLNHICDHLDSRQDSEMRAIKASLQASSGGIPWLGRKPSCNESVDLNKYTSDMELELPQGYPRPMAGSTSAHPELECNMQNFPSTLLIGNRTQRKEVDSLNCKKFFGSPIPGKIHQKSISIPSDQGQSVAYNSTSREKNDSSCGELSADIKAPSTEKENPVGRPVPFNGWYRNHINLNSTCMDDSCSTPEVEIEAPLVLPSPTLDAKLGSGVNSEAPISSRPEKTTVHDEPIPSSKTLAMEAAENIVQMSMGDLPLPQAPCDALQWFANFISSKGYECLDDGLDHFELMTLKLEETKPEDYLLSPQEPQNQDDQEKVDASLLLTRPKRGKARRRRQQRRDFQKDILPGLASLSMLEATEDLQTIGGLMKSSGWSWEAVSTRRNARKRGRRQPRSLAIAKAEIEVVSVKGWGRTTRRCRRQRCPPVGLTAPLT